MITAMAASSLLRLLRPGPTTLSKSSWEFSPEVSKKYKVMELLQEKTKHGPINNL